MADFTPGPWATNSECGDESVLSSNGAMVADCAIFGTSRTFRARGGGNVANALLIAAAPDLLAALQGLKSIIDRAESNASGNLEWHDVSKRVNAARAAIFKAIGKDA